MTKPTSLPEQAGGPSKPGASGTGPEPGGGNFGPPSESSTPTRKADSGARTFGDRGKSKRGRGPRSAGAGSNISNMDKISKAKVTSYGEDGSGNLLMHMHYEGDTDRTPGYYLNPSIIYQPILPETRYLAEYGALGPYNFATQVLEAIVNDGNMRQQFLGQLGVVDEPTYDDALQKLIEYGMLIELSVSLLVSYYTMVAIKNFTEAYSQVGTAKSAVQDLVAQAYSKANALRELLATKVYYPKFVQMARAAHSAIAIKHSSFNVRDRLTVWHRPHPQMILTTNNNPPATRITRTAGSELATIFNALHAELTDIRYAQLTGVLSNFNARKPFSDHIGWLGDIKGTDVTLFSRPGVNHQQYLSHINMPAFVEVPNVNGVIADGTALPRWIAKCHSHLYYFTFFGDKPPDDWFVNGHCFVDGVNAYYGPIGTAALLHATNQTQDCHYAHLWTYNDVFTCVELSEIDEGHIYDMSWVQERTGKSTFLRPGSVQHNGTSVFMKTGEEVGDTTGTGGSVILGPWEMSISPQAYRARLVMETRDWLGADPVFNIHIKNSLMRHTPRGWYAEPFFDLLGQVLANQGITGVQTGIAQPGGSRPWGQEVTSATA